jgi:hypothetical protein
VAEDLRRFDGWVSDGNWPHVSCPTCLVGHLAVETIDGIAAAASARHFLREPNPTGLHGVFHGVLRCAIATCGEPIAIAGEYAVDADVDETGDNVYVDVYKLRFATPPLRIQVAPVRTPESVAKAIEAASYIIWADPSSAANRLRVAIDELLTAYGMRRFDVVNHKRRRLSTHQRIQEFKRMGN